MSDTQLLYMTRLVASLEKQLAQAEADRDVLAAEVRANRAVSSMADDGDSHGMQWDRGQVMQWNLACKARRLAIDATDTSGALDRAKEAK